MFNLIGKTLGPYRILEQIGAGGMATVYKAYQPSMDRFVAIKVLPPYFSQDEQFIKRFQREAHAIAKLEHAHILPSFDYGECEGVTYIAMRYIQAGTLKELLSKGLLPMDEIARIIGQISSALQYSHQLGIIHRDVKPSNVLMGEQGNIYLTDFGLARIVDSKQHLTGTGVGVGTPAYTSPEQGLGNKTDHRSDIYSLGVVLYEMVTRHIPYEAETPMAVVLKHINEPLPLPSSIKPDVPESVELVILKALEKDPAHRFQSAGELAEALSIAIRKVKAVESSAETITFPPREKPKPTWLRSPWKLVIIGGAGLALLFFGILISRLLGNFPSTGVQPATSFASTPPPTTAPVKEEVPSLIPAAPITPADLRGYLSVCGTDLCITTTDNRVAELGLAKSYTQLNSFGWSPDGSKLVFSACSQENAEKCAELFIADLNSGAVSQIPHVLERPKHAMFPAWSPDGNWIAFHDDGALALIRPDGTERHEIATATYCPSNIVWSPDSQRLAYIANLCRDTDESPSFLLTVLANGNNLRLLWQNKTDGFSDLAYGPGGNLLAVRQESGGTFWVDPNCEPGSEGCPETSRRKLEIMPDQWLHTYFPRWGKDVSVPAPDGKEATTCNNQEKNGTICVWNSKDRNLARITDGLSFPGQMGTKTWSPDGKQIAFSAAVTENGAQKLYVINNDGANLRQITSGSTYDHEVAWSPDGEWLAFQRNCGLWLIRSDGTQAHMLIDSIPDKLCNEAPSWSPDSQKIVVLNIVGNDRPSELWVVSREGSDSHRIYSIGKPIEFGWAGWNPDGSLIFINYRIGDQQSHFMMNADGSEVHEIDWEPYWWNTQFWPPWGKEIAP